MADVNIHTGAVLELRDRDHLGTGSLALKLGAVPAEQGRLPSKPEWVVPVGERERIEVQPDRVQP